MESDQSYFSLFDSSSWAEGQLSPQFFGESKEKPVPSKKPWINTAHGQSPGFSDLPTALIMHH